MSSKKASPKESTPNADIPVETRTRPTVWFSPGDTYRLEELVHPHHLIIEGRAMKHCIDKTVIDGRWPQLDLKLSQAHRLLYWTHIQSGDRIFSFVGSDGPLVTIWVGISQGRNRFIQIRGRRNHAINGSEGYFETLLAALSYIDTLYPYPLTRPPKFPKPVTPATLPTRSVDRAYRRLNATCSALDEQLGHLGPCGLAEFLYSCLEITTPYRIVSAVIREHPPFHMFPLSYESKLQLIHALVELQASFDTLDPTLSEPLMHLAALPPWKPDIPFSNKTG